MTVSAISQVFTEFQSRLPLLTQMQTALQNLIASATASTSSVKYDISADIAFFKAYDIKIGTGQESDFITHMNNILTAAGGDPWADQIGCKLEVIRGALSAYIPDGNPQRQWAPGAIDDLMNTCTNSLTAGLVPLIQADLDYFKSLKDTYMTYRLSERDDNSVEHQNYLTYMSHYSNIMNAINASSWQPT